MTLYSFCHDYLHLINMISEKPGMYHLDNLRQKIHLDIQNETNSNPERLKLILHNLNIAIDFNPPNEKHDSVKIYSRNLEFLLMCQASRQFLTGKSARLTTSYGVINTDNK